MSSKSNSLKLKQSSPDKTNVIAEIEVINVDVDDDDDEVYGIVVEEEKPKTRYAYMSMVVVDFIHGIIPSRNLFREKKGNFVSSIVRNHGYFRALSGSTMHLSRTVRFVGLVIILLTEIFADTLFFGIFYPSDGTCDVYTTEVGTVGVSVVSSTELVVSMLEIVAIDRITSNYHYCYFYYLEHLHCYAFQDFCIRVSMLMGPRRCYLLLERATNLICLYHYHWIDNFSITATCYFYYRVCLRELCVCLACEQGVSR